MRPVRLLLAVFILLLCAFVASFADAYRLAATQSGNQAARTALARRLQLTDLALFSEARYTRHLSQADHHAPFQDHPGAIEHFPAGSLVGPPVAGR
jgi:hypothetical protein